MILDDDKTIQSKLDHAAANEANIMHQLKNQKWILQDKIAGPVEIKLWFTVNKYKDQLGDSPMISYVTTQVSQDQLIRLNCDIPECRHMLYRRYRTLENLKLREEVYNEIFEVMKERFYKTIALANEIYHDIKLENIYISRHIPFEMQ